MIPKIIHYIWLGGEKDEIIQKAIHTWKKRAPEFRIIEWNEKNLPKYENSFYQEALKDKNYAIASDYARLSILKKYGGVYMDTDMFLLANPSNLLTNKDLVFGIQNKDIIFSAGFIASIPGQEFISRALNVYNRVEYNKEKLIANTALLSPLMFSMYEFEHKAKTQVRGKVVAYNPNVLLQPSFKSVAMHIGEKAWMDHTIHDKLRIRFRQHITNQLEAGIFAIVNNIGRKIIP